MLDNMPYLRIADYILDFQDEFVTNDKDEAIYDRDVASKSYIIPARAAMPIQAIDCTPTVAVPFFKLANNPFIEKEHPIFCEEELIDRCIIMGTNDVKRQLDCEVLKVINKACTKEHTSIVLNAPYLLNGVVKSISLLNDSELSANVILCHPKTFWMMDSIGNKDWELTGFSSYNADIDEHPIWAYFKGVPVIVSTMIPKSLIFVLPHPAFVGVVAARTDLKALPMKECYENKIFTVPEPNDNLIQYVVHGEYAVAAINDWAITRVMFKGSESSSNLGVYTMDEHETVLRQGEPNTRKNYQIV